MFYLEKRNGNDPRFDLLEPNPFIPHMKNNRSEREWNSIRNS